MDQNDIMVNIQGALNEIPSILDDAAQKKIERKAIVNTLVLDQEIEDEQKENDAPGKKLVAT